MATNVGGGGSDDDSERRPSYPRNTRRGLGKHYHGHRSHRELFYSGKQVETVSTKQTHNQRGGRGTHSSGASKGTSPRKPTHIHRLEVRDLIEMARCPPAEVVTKIHADLKGFQESLNTCSKVSNPSTKLHYTLAVITVLFKVSSMQSEESATILAEFLSERCSQFHVLLKEYINVLALEDKQPERNFRKLHDLFLNLLTCLPASAWCVLPIDDLADAVQYQNFDVKLCTDIVQLKSRRDEIRGQIKHKPRHDESVWDNSEFRHFPILPTMEEICTSSPPQLRSNIIKGAYSGGWEHYYDVQFRLLREDFIAPLRRGVSEFQQFQRSRRFLDINLYTGVHLFEPIFTYEGLCYQVKFDASRFKKRRNWMHSKRLIFGSLLCFSPQYDKFNEECYFATVTNREPAKLSLGLFEVQFEDGLSVLHHLKKTAFFVIESKAYFEASRHILRSLQTAEVDTMPFTRYIVTNQCTSVDKPKYLECGGKRPLYDLQWLYPEKDRIRMHESRLDSDLPSFLRSYHGSEYYGRHEEIDITNKWQWPDVNDLELDDSQLEAVKMALTQEIAVIQGPPGTGKTYIGYKIVQTLLQNRCVWDPDQSSPILVMCYTNHALDQFLEGIISHKIKGSDMSLRTPKIVRVGSRSASEKIQEFSLHNVRKEYVPGFMWRHVNELKEEMNLLGSRIPWESLHQVAMNPVNELMVSFDGMMRLRPFIDPAHFYQIVEAVDDDSMKIHSLEVWLGLWDKHGVEHIREPHTNDVEAGVLTPLTDNSELNDGDESEDEDSFVDVLGEAELEEASRKIDIIDFRRIERIEERHAYESDALTEHVKQYGDSSGISQEVKWEKKDEHQMKIILNQIRRTECLEAEQEIEIADVNSLSLRERWQLFQLWISKYHSYLDTISEGEMKKFVELSRLHKREMQGLDRYALENVEVIGMTTTGAAKYQHILHLVKPKIVVVEEAAEVLEAHIVSALNAGTQHLILIGDHKQLRPKPNEYDLARKHNLDVSLFERLIRNNFPHTTLHIQHRMRPEIANLVCPFIYERLDNHEMVLNYDEITSFDKNMYFFQHDKPEEDDEHLLSHSNEYEAIFVVELCKHLLKQGYSPSQITILTAYTGQLLKVRAKMPRAEFEGVRIVNVDNFQGEENDIILLSLVRSNSDGKVGFLKEENRVCVALSRAKKGFYCFGNFFMLRKVVPIWELILSYVEMKGCLGSALPMYCPNHKDKKFAITEPEDFFKYFPEGGCNTRCQYRLDCGHCCRRKCHLDDVDHLEYKCKEPCDKLCLAEKHSCSGKCSDTCPPCNIIVTKTIPECGHLLDMPCSEIPFPALCTNPCTQFCANDLHPCPQQCGEKCSPCQVFVKRKMPFCQHEQEIECHKDESNELCQHPCDKSCPNGHMCPLLCWEKCGVCVIDVMKRMPNCGHYQTVPCHVSPFDFNCQEMCERVYSCQHKCPKRCHEVCDPVCQVIVEKQLLKCQHIEAMPCHQNPNSWKCSKPCERILDCGHRCQGLCGDECSSTQCSEPTRIQRPCKHTIVVICKEVAQTRLQIFKGSEQYMCHEPCMKRLKCGHNCRNACSQPCTDLCETKVTSQCPSGHNLKLICHQKEDPQFVPQCSSPCILKLPCGHKCTKKCHEACSEQCSMLVSKLCLCGHMHKRQCGDSAQVCSCVENCSVILQCGHRCSGKCGECFSTRLHKPCVYDVQVNRWCGHFGTVPCYGITDQCKKECRISSCPHATKLCRHKCFEGCSKLCSEDCILSCPHRKCSEICSEVCDSLSCERPCEKLLRCRRHHCPGLCGEKCLDLCMFCDKKKFLKVIIGIGKDKKVQNHRYIQLDCGHIFTVDYLDRSLKPKPNEDHRISPLVCPTCFVPITSPYFWRLNRERYIEIKEVIELLPAVTDSVTVIPPHEKDMAMNIIRKVCKPSKRINLEDSPDSLCAVALLLRVNELHTAVTCQQDLSIQAHSLLLSVASIVAIRAKVSLQVISDVESEVYRISLSSFTLRIQSQLAADSCDKSLGAVQSVLQQMEENHTLRITKSEYEQFFDDLQQAHMHITGSSLHPLVTRELIVPKVTKGEWYRCSNAGHIYFTPAKYTKKKGKGGKCPTCF